MDGDLGNKAGVRVLRVVGILDNTTFDLVWRPWFDLPGHLLCQEKELH